MVISYKKWKKHNKIQLTKNKMELNNRKMTNHPPSPASNTTEFREYVAEKAKFMMSSLL